MEYDVTIDRDLYIGGSDIPAIMNISPFKTRYELLLEKAGLRENDFSGNRYTEYGKVIEPQIRAYINRRRKKKFEPNQTINEDLRAHTDGFNGECVLEIKSTSDIHEDIDGYIVYLVQLLFYMNENKVTKGLLAVYERPEDFNPEFTPERLSTFDVEAGEYKSLTDRIYAEITRFRADLARLKDNPLLSEEDFQPNELVTLSNKVLALESRMAEFKQIEKQYKDVKQTLFEAMTRHNIKSWETPNGTKITRVDGTVATVQTVTEFDVDTFKEEHTELFEKYQKTVEKKTSARAGYVKITLP